MSNLAKSLADLDAAADELLNKSVKSDNQDELSPEDIADSSAEPVEPDEEKGAEFKEDKKKGKKKPDNLPEEEPKESEDEELDKSEDEEDDEEAVEVKPEEDNLEDADEEEDEEYEIEKSIRKDFETNPAIAKGMEASEFLGAIVEVLSKGLTDVQKNIDLNGHTQEGANEVLAKSLQASLKANTSLIEENEKLRADNARISRRITKLEKSMGEGFEKLVDMLDEISSQPTMRKSMVSVHDRNFGASIEGHPVAQKTGFESLSKSQVMNVLTNELFAGNPNVTNSDIIGYESGAPLRSDLQQLVVNKIQ